MMHHVIQIEIVVSHSTNITRKANKTVSALAVVFPAALSCITNGALQGCIATMLIDLNTQPR